MSERAERLQAINEMGFMVNDLTRYLDSHPLDTGARDELKRALAERRRLLAEYARDYEPLASGCVCPDGLREGGPDQR